MDDRDLISRLQDLLAAERWANEGGQVAPDRVLDRERAEARREKNAAYYKESAK